MIVDSEDAIYETAHFGYEYLKQSGVLLMVRNGQEPDVRLLLGIDLSGIAPVSCSLMSLPISPSGAE